MGMSRSSALASPERHCWSQTVTSPDIGRRKNIAPGCPGSGSDDAIKLMAKKSQARSLGTTGSEPPDTAANCGTVAWEPRIVEPDDGFELFARLDVIARSETVAVIAAPAAVAAGGELTAVINGHRVVVVNERAAAARAAELAAERGAGIAMAP